MVDFKKLVTKVEKKKKIHPCDIYQSLDWAVDKGPLRPIQKDILDLWNDKFRDERDVILKLHTGQGKTLIGLLMLQSKINEEAGPALYLCPNNYLVAQTCQQADSFGIPYTTFEMGGFDDFVDGKTLLITSVSKLFNGLTKFGLDHNSINVSSLVMDDSHACIDMLKKSCRVELKSTSNAYQELLTLFEEELEKQGGGTYADLRNGQGNAYLPVPYWDWQDKRSEVARILSKYKESEEICFAWPLIKDDLKDCLCVISGKSLEITPYIVPLEKFGSYHKAANRIFMSATLIDDSFFIKGLGVSADAVRNPLCVKGEKWSGERMILIPELIDADLEREEIVKKFSVKVKSSVVVLSPSFRMCQDWKGYGCTVATTDTIDDEIDKLKQRKEPSLPLVIVNRYDGIDLPDSACRILILDSKPFAQSLSEKYIEDCRRNSNFINKKMAQIVEQGLGRGVRGEKDYCVVLILGSSLVKLVKSKETQKYFSPQTRAQVQMGLEIAKMAEDELKSGESGFEILRNTMNQLLGRNEDWKSYYFQRMNSLKIEKAEEKLLEIFVRERGAEKCQLNNDPKGALKVYQSIIDDYCESDDDVGWYLQEMARVSYSISKSEADKLQLNAHKKNRELLLPRNGVEIEQIPLIGTKRIENIVKWLQSFPNNEELILTVTSFLANLRMGVNADDFESAFDELGKSLGFNCQRPDKEFREGPDNLWNLRDGLFLLVECKNDVDVDRAEIGKKETGQMNNSCAWFDRVYHATSKNIMVISPKAVGRAAGFNKDVEIMRAKSLKTLVHNVRCFFSEFKDFDLKDISEKKIQELLVRHHLSVEDLLTMYSEKPVYLGRE